MIDRYSYNTPYRQPMRLGDVWFDATMERSRSYSSDVPTYPVEKGFKISDAVLKNPLQITLKAVISEMPLTFRQEGYGAYANTRHVTRVLEELQEMYYIAEPVSLYTNSGTYDNLVIQSMTFPETTEMVNAVEVSITLKQVRITGNYDVIAATSAEANDDTASYDGKSGERTHVAFYDAPRAAPLKSKATPNAPIFGEVDENTTQEQINAIMEQINNDFMSRRGVIAVTPSDISLMAQTKTYMTGIAMQMEDGRFKYYDPDGNAYIVDSPVNARYKLGLE